MLRLGSVAADAVARLDETLGTELASEIPEDQLDAELVLVDSNELADAQGLTWHDRIAGTRVVVLPKKE